MKFKYILIDVSQILFRGAYIQKTFVESGEFIENDDGYFDIRRINVDGIILLLSRVIKFLKKGQVILCFDSPHIIKKMNNNQDYKGGRKKVSTYNIKEQSIMARLIAEDLGIPYFIQDGYEADDILQSLTYQLLGRDDVSEVILVNKDADLWHLCNDERVSMLVDGTSKRPDEVYDKYRCFQDIEPKMSLINRVLDGKSSNNIKGFSNSKSELINKLIVIRQAIKQGQIPATIASDPIELKKTLLTLVGADEELIDRMYYLFPVVLTETSFDVSIREPNVRKILDMINRIRVGSIDSYVERIENL